MRWQYVTAYHCGRRQEVNNPLALKEAFNVSCRGVNNIGFFFPQISPLLFPLLICCRNERVCAEITSLSHKAVFPQRQSTKGVAQETLGFSAAWQSCSNSPPWKSRNSWSVCLHQPFCLHLGPLSFFNNRNSLTHLSLVLISIPFPCPWTPKHNSTGSM